MIVKLSLGELERARLVLRGGSVLDWHRLDVGSLDECLAILRANGFDLEDEGDRSYLKNMRLSAIDYLTRNFGFSFLPEIFNAPSAGDLMLLAAGKDSLRRRQACVVLKVMHVLHHAEAMELKSRLNIAEHELYHIVEDKAVRVIEAMKERGYPIVDFQCSRKTRDSIITKLLHKKQGNRALLYDMIRFRIVTATAEEIVPAIAYLSIHLFPFHYTVPGESRNSIFDFRDFIRRHPRISRMIPEFQVDLMYENEMRGPSNPETNDTFRTASFVVDIPIRLDDRQLELWAPGARLSSRVVHVLAEFQIVDEASHAGNEQGEASHVRYKDRRLSRVKERLLRGRMVWNDKAGE
ncbi:TIGR04552 family protein [Syntrophus buswellii]|mgnify:CR=1 FL=1|jgi:uncharacterized protein (TIGR04552 family)|uniref:TIGR04552 family protein n=1 Tax=Syntrophus TaxID=43773 RepID=UPI0009CD707C|nr:MAG: hypothetical protein A4E69_03386 [Syntrophus sp. PtaB.Bin138]